MKLLIMLSVLASSAAFANADHGKWIKCYEAPQQQGNHELAYKFKTYGDEIKLVYPERISLGQVVTDAEEDAWTCLEDKEPEERFLACRTEGQRVNGLVPVEINEEETVYCQHSILDWINGFPPR